MIDTCHYYWMIYCDIDSNIYIDDFSLIRDGIVISSYWGICEQYEWGEPELFFRDSDLRLQTPDMIIIKWHDKDNEICHAYKIDLSHTKCFKNGDILVVGVTSHGNLAVWLISINKSRLIYKVQNKRTENTSVSITQFIYRYVICLINQNEIALEKAEKSNESVCVFDDIEEALYDGTYDKLHESNLLKYHEAGKPKKLAIKWHREKTEYVAYFWFEDEKIREVFDKFYGVHPDTKTDFIIRIDAENKKYELALYRYGLKEPQVIPEDVYQLLVFKNKFEDYRSENYNQERGAWIW